jgi:uncharacterized ferritin-like protein (DUF455 family)
MSIRRHALQLLRICDPDDKAARTLAFDDGGIAAEPDTHLAEPGLLPGRPRRPALVPQAQLVQRSVGTIDGRRALLHALAHIEHNAINLALDACWRFDAMPDAYYRDWLSVARDEARHFCLLRDHLAGLGCHYGDFPAHDGLWDMVLKTRDDVLARMALVPRTLEARGLDACPTVRQRLVSVRDLTGAAIIDVILHDEIRHVAIGNRWYRHLCRVRGLDPLAHYPILCARYQAPALQGPFNIEARKAAGFTDSELSYLLDGNQNNMRRDTKET